ncbi:NAD/NADP transhydrogenase alpha subunit [Paenibacillus sp. PsM32]|uniref:NAD/NADP transhydrogenase alpha subunit n=2 Tax=Paenibacillus TaxID=44249 RepID=A0ABW4UUQ0_9BACL|nr:MULTISPECIES: NAD/NADP transhydrogenase alpha subunit [Paenibacillus]MDN4617953.1 NAD/NADP transhydrogenase alpha subunit [Paenibacillus sp. PsM32]MDQ1234674.1 uncharacterized protein YaiI (UPF0178 family) [Paenibacillus sp. SORGH_AS_0306]MDR6111719.1 uncharacterized protein YaiI (UPF0178 family) [Paenibacillus sp. SORGH_AS_0338]WCT54268.1 NAD/NADP transhydrogenase alpha subunit [Paenibacillus kyungheensis]WDF52601.1 NAD/NADP transhydrogenase alpha subunit [Paenibacillus sp. KACC 21273]
MKCISVYTDNFEQFSDIFEQVVAEELAENEEKEVDGITVNYSGDVPDYYIERMAQKRDVVVMKDKGKGITILQHGKLFEILVPVAEKEASVI